MFDRVDCDNLAFNLIVSSHQTINLGSEFSRLVIALVFTLELIIDSPTRKT